MFETKVVEYLKTYFVFNNVSFFFSENRAVCVTMWKNIVESDRPEMTVWRKRFASWTPKARNTLNM